MVKVKHARTADCAVAGFRWHKDGPGTMVGSLLLGLVRRRRACCSTSASARASRRRAGGSSSEELAPLREGALEEHPWRDWAQWRGRAPDRRMPGATSRWNRGKDLTWEPLRVERVCEVAYDHLQGDRFRHATHFLRWRPDKPPRDCRYDQLEVTPPYELRRSSVRAAAGIVVGVGGSSAGAPLGDVARFTRTRVQVVNRPRIASTSTSSGASRPPPPGGALPALEPRERVLGRGPRDRDERPAVAPASGRRLAARGLTRAARRPSRSAAARARRPARRALPRGELEQRLERARRRVDPAPRSPSRAKRAGIVRSVKSAGSQCGDLLPGERRRDAGVGRGPHRVGGRDGAVLRVLVVVDEDAVPLLLPPLARRERRRAPLDLARERERRAGAPR